MKLSIVILNWNGEQMLRKFLPSVTASCADMPDVEVCVADNASTDNSLEVLRREFPTVRLIVLDRNYGFAEGYNRAIAQTEAQYTLLLNSDVEVTPGWLTPLLGYMEAHPEVAACQPKIRSWRQRQRFEHAGAAGGYIDALGYPFCRGRLMDTVEDDHGQYDTPTRIAWATGAALLIRTELYRQTGGLDARFFAHMEEIDLCWRLCSRGHLILCLPQSTVYHVGGATLNQGNPRKTYLNFRNNLLMLYKNLPSRRLLPVLTLRLLLDGVAALQFIVRGRFGDAGAVCRAHYHFWSMHRDFRADRRINLQLATRPTAALSPLSLLWQYYIRRRRTFGDLTR